MAGEAFGEFLKFGGPAKAFFRRANPATTYQFGGKPLAHLMLNKSIKMPADDVCAGCPQAAAAAARWVHCILPPF
jgi:hypothetical protein